MNCVFEIGQCSNSLPKAMMMNNTLTLSLEFSDILYCFNLHNNITVIIMEYSLVPCIVAVQGLQF